MFMNFRPRTLTILSLTLLLTALSATTSTVHAPISAPVSTPGSPPVTDPVSPQQFSITCSPTLLTLGTPGTGNSTCYVTSLNRFAGNVGITAIVEPLPILGGVCINAVCTSTSQPIIFTQSLLANATTTFTVSVNVGASDIPWDYSVALIANSGTEYHSFILEVNVGPTAGTGPADYSLTQSASSLSITAGGANGTDTITISSSTYTDPVSLAATVAPAVHGGPQISFSGGVNLPAINLTAIVLPGPSLTRTATLNVKMPAGATGSYLIIVQATGGTGQPFDQHSAVLAVNFDTLTQASITAPANPTVNNKAVFTANTNGGTPPFKYSWTWGDGSVSGVKDQSQGSHIYVTAGNYTVMVTVTDSLGKTVNASTTITVK